MSHPLISKAVTWFFNELNNRRIKYAVLRKVELVPENIGNDIDVLITKEEEPIVLKAVNDCAEKFEFKIYERKNTKGFYPILYAFVDNELIFFRLDFTNPAKDPEKLLQQRLKNEKGIYYTPQGLYEKKEKNTFKNLLTYPIRLLFPQGKFVVIVGPDGVGKSTTAKLTAKILEAFHVPVSHVHLGFRPKILPTKKGLMSFGKEKPAPGEESNVPGLFRFLYHAFDNFLGFWFVVRPALIRGRVFIGERYFYSYLVDSRTIKRYGLPAWFVRLVLFFMPKPDIVILLSGDPEEIYRRRQEHDVNEISRQLVEYRKWGMRARSFLEVKTDKFLPEVAMAVAHQLIPKKYKLAVVASHPIQYQSPIWREIAKNPDIELMVYYCVDWGVSKPQFDSKEFFGVKYKWDIPLLEGYKYKFLRNYSLKPGPYLGGFINPGIFLRLWKNKYDAVLVLGWMDVTFWFSFLAAKLKRLSVLLRVVNSSRYDKNVKRPKFLMFLKKIYLKTLFHSFVSAFLAIGTWNKEMYLEHGVSPRRIFHFPYAVWNEFFMNETEKNKKDKEEIRRELSIGPETKVITYAARFVEDKHPEEAIQAYEELIKDEPGINACLLMIGDGPMRPALEKEVKAKKLKNIIFTGFKNQTELVRLYAVTDVFIRTDGFFKGDWGATVNEAMACGLPIVAPDTIASGVDLIREGENGFIYRFGDIDTLANSIKKIITNEKLLESMKNKSKEIIGHWSYKEDVEGLLKALEHCRKSF